MLYCKLHYCSSLDNFYNVDLVLDDYDYNKILIIKFKTWVYIYWRDLEHSSLVPIISFILFMCVGTII